MLRLRISYKWLLKSGLKTKLLNRRLKMYARFPLSSNWDEMDRLKREMNRLFDGLDPTRRPLGGYPALNLWVGEEDQVVTAELPGVRLDDLEIHVLGSSLSISGERSADDLPEDAETHRQERMFRRFSRSIELPYPVEAGKVEATLEKGLLTIRLPRAEADKPKKIKVKTT
jgi:HSP20 family protein